MCNSVECHSYAVLRRCKGGRNYLELCPQIGTGSTSDFSSEMGGLAQAAVLCLFLGYTVSHLCHSLLLTDDVHTAQWYEMYTWNHM